MRTGVSAELVLTTMRPYNDNNVYILGAGFSAEAGLPVISSFLSKMRDAVDWLDKAGRVSERDAIERVLDFRHQSAAAGYRINIDLDNIEHLFSLADAKSETASTDYVRLAIASTLDFAAKTGRAPIGRMRVSQLHGWPCTDAWLSTAQRKLEANLDGFRDVESSIYDYYAAVLSGLSSDKRDAESNVVITLNYDIVLEEALCRLNIPFSYKLGPGTSFDETAQVNETNPAALQVLKLHGSINWGQRVDDGSLIVCPSYENVRTLDLVPLLVPPTWQKIAADTLLSVWDAAETAISKATRIVLIGFSIPATDQHFKYLLSVGLKENSSLRTIRIVDPQATSLLSQYKAVFREDQFKYGIASTRDKYTAQFMYNQDELTQLNRFPAHPGLAIVADQSAVRYNRS